MGNCQNNTQSADSAHGKQQTEKDSIPKHNVLIKTATWGRDSHGLFDYEAHDLTNGEFRLKGPSQVYRKANVVAMKGDGEVSTEEDSDLLHISNTDDFLYVHANQSLLNTFRNNGPTSGSPANKAASDAESNDKAVWLVIKALKKLQGYSKGYQLKEGDIIKLGRVRFRVKELCVDSTKPSTNKPQVDDKSVFLVRKPSIGKDHDGSKNVPICRICLCECGEEENPLVNPCRCDGTMKYVHILCLQTWLKSRLQTKTTPIAFTVAWKTLDCELCHKPFPSILEVDGVRYYPLEMPRSEAKSYVILEVLSKDTPQVRGLHLINMTLKPVIKLGRGHESDLRIADISVSRNHATITFDQDGFYLNDHDSKFGSLVQARKAFPLIPELSGMMVQVGRTVCTFDVPSKQTTFPLSLLGSTASQKPIAFEFNREHQECEDFNELNNNLLESFKDVQNQKDGRKTTIEERPQNNGANEVVQSPGHRNPQIIEEPANIEELLYENNPVQGGA